MNMKEKIDELYQEYLFDKLDLIFNSETGEKQHVKAGFGRLKFSEVLARLKPDKKNYTIVSKGKGLKSVYNLKNANGRLISKQWFDKIDGFYDGLAIVSTSEGLAYNRKYNLMTTNGDLLGPWDRYVFRLDPEYSMHFIIYGATIIPRRIEMDGYNVEKTLIGYKCVSSHDKLLLKYQPIKKFGYRYTLCFDKNIIYLHDRINNQYIKIGNANDVEYDDNFILYREDEYLKKVYFIYDGKLLDIPVGYYKKYIEYKNEINVTKGIGNILTREEFSLMNMSQIDKMLEEEKRKNLEIKKQQEKEQEERELKKAKKKSEQNVKNDLIIKKEALEKIQELLKILENLEKNAESYTRISITNIFIQVGDHKEINPIYLEEGILKHIDLNYISFKNVKIDGIDFRGCNISLNPQEVYGKNLNGCNFEGLYIGPFMDFNGVDIRGARFSDDNDPRTLDRMNVTFQNAIYDETTTYNGKSFSEIFDNNIKNSIK